MIATLCSDGGRIGKPKAGVGAFRPSGCERARRGRELPLP